MAPRVTPAPERFWSKVRLEGECWVWAAQINRYGYGVFRASTHAKTSAHRWSYAYMVADIPDGLQLDHLCRNRACVNPYHLEPVTNAVNSGRGEQAFKSHCSRGHAYTPENTRINTRPNGATYRTCKECDLIRGAAWRAKNAA